jgi:acyl-CoA synthetase (AMP-forming)/AMP-acid ligase II
MGEICRVAPDTSLFQGYFDNPEANRERVRDGVYHSGDLGRILVRTEALPLLRRPHRRLVQDGEELLSSQVARAVRETRTSCSRPRTASPARSPTSW